MRMTLCPVESVSLQMLIIIEDGALMEVSFVVQLLVLSDCNEMKANVGQPTDFFALLIGQWEKLNTKELRYFQSK